MDASRSRVCVCYITSASLLGIFVYIVLGLTGDHRRQLDNFRDEMEAIAQSVLHAAPMHGKEGKHKSLTSVVDEVLKDRLTSIQKDLYSMKNKVKASECIVATNTLTAEPPSDALSSYRDMRINYASEDLGARISYVEAVPVGGTMFFKSLLNLDFSANPPVNMLKPEIEPGSCFAFEGQTANITIKLAKEIYVEAIEVEHLSRFSSPNADTSSAPKYINVAGLQAENAKEAILGACIFENDPSKSRQYCSLALLGEKYKFLRLRFSGNHGNSKYTCVYNVAVYGKMV